MRLIAPPSPAPPEAKLVAGDAVFVWVIVGRREQREALPGPDLKVALLGVEGGHEAVKQVTDLGAREARHINNRLQAIYPALIL